MRRALFLFCAYLLYLQIATLSLAVDFDQDVPSGRGLLGRCAANFSNCTYEQYQYDMWETLKSEPCLKSLVYQFDFISLRTAEFIYLLHRVHIYQYPLSLFCNTDKSGPMDINDIVKLYDDHTSLSESSDMHPFDHPTNGKTGVIIAPDPRLDKTVVWTLAKDSPAYQAGIRPLDELVSVDGASVAQDAGDIVGRLTGEPGTSATVRMRRSEGTQTFTVLRREYESPTAEWGWCGDVGYIHLLDFGIIDMEEYLLPAFQEFYARGVRRIVFDLRGNSGGHTVSAVRLSGLFLPKGKSLVFIERTPYLYEKGEEKQTAPLIGRGWLQRVQVVILVNHLTASASEIFTGALSSYHRAVVIGEATYGKGTGQIPVLLSNEGRMMITAFRWFTPSGASVEGVGISPDISTEDAVRGAPPDPIENCIYPDDKVLRYSSVAPINRTNQNGQ